MINIENKIYELANEIYEKLDILTCIKTLNNKDYKIDMEKFKHIYYEFWKKDKSSDDLCNELLSDDITKYNVYDNDSRDIRDGSTMNRFIPLGYFIKKRDYLNSIINNYHKHLYEELNNDLNLINKIISENQEKYDKKVVEKEKEKNRKRREATQYGYVYIIKVDQYYKIGQTTSMKKRIGEYTKLMKEPEIVINVLCTHYRDVEKELHQMFFDKNTNGEWFLLSDEDVNNAINYLRNIELKPDSEEQTA